VTCDSCGKPNPSNFKFCKHCGVAKRSTKTFTPAIGISSEPTPNPASLSPQEIPSSKVDNKKKKSSIWILIIIGIALLGAGTFLFLGSPTKNKDPLDIAKAQKSNPSASGDSKSVEITPSTLREQAQPYIQAMITSIQANNKSGLEKNVGLITGLPKPAAGDRKVARKFNEAGLAFLKVNNFDAAIASFKDAVIADQTDQEVANNLGYAYYLSGDLDRAKSLIEYTLALAPQRTSAWTNYAVILFKQGLDEPAINAYLVAYKYAKNQDRLLIFVEKQAQEDVDVQLRPFYSQVINAINQRK
jgi:tetratricopeptide (TPR) repeat protein